MGLFCLRVMNSAWWELILLIKKPSQCLRGCDFWSAAQAHSSGSGIPSLFLSFSNSFGLQSLESSSRISLIRSFA